MIVRCDNEDCENFGKSMELTEEDDRQEWRKEYYECPECHRKRKTIMEGTRMKNKQRTYLTLYLISLTSTLGAIVLAMASLIIDNVKNAGLQVIKITTGQQYQIHYWFPHLTFILDGFAILFGILAIIYGIKFMGEEK